MTTGETDTGGTTPLANPYVGPRPFRESEQDGRDNREHGANIRNERERRCQKPEGQCQRHVEPP